MRFPFGKKKKNGEHFLVIVLAQSTFTFGKMDNETVNTCSFGTLNLVIERYDITGQFDPAFVSSIGRYLEPG